MSREEGREKTIELSFFEARSLMARLFSEEAEQRKIPESRFSEHYEKDLKEITEAANSHDLVHLLNREKSVIARVISPRGLKILVEFYMNYESNFIDRKTQDLEPKTIDSYIEGRAFWNGFVQAIERTTGKNLFDFDSLADYPTLQ